MTPLVLVLVLFLIVAVLGLFILKRQGGLSDAWPFYAKKALSDPEQVLFHRLVKSLPECIVLAQVQASRVLGVKKGFNFGQWNNQGCWYSVASLVGEGST